VIEAYWTEQVSGNFDDASDWSTSTIPDSADSAILNASGDTAYTVTSSATQSVADVETAPTATLDISSGEFAATNGTGTGANLGTIVIADDARLSAGGTINNSGVIDMVGTKDGADLVVGAAGLTLDGGGALVLADAITAPFQPCPPKYSLDRILGTSGATFTNVDDTLTGAGYIGLGELNLVNEAAGVIDASLTTDINIQVIGSVVNAGLIEATGAGGLYINYATVYNAGGVIAGAGGKIYLETGADIIGGTLTSTGGGRDLPRLWTRHFRRIDRRSAGQSRLRVGQSGSNPLS